MPIPPFLGSGAAEIVGMLLVPLLGALLGSALSAALTAAVTTLAVLSALHGMGLSLAMGSHRLHRQGHWLLRPLLFSAAFAVLAVGSLATNALLIGDALLDEQVSGWMMLAPVSAAVAQVGSGVIVGLWCVDRLVRLLGDYLKQVGVDGSERAHTWWRRVSTVGRWLSVALWSLAALGLIGGSLLGAVVAIPLLVTNRSAFVPLAVHVAMMLLGVAAGVVLLVTRLAFARKKEGSTRTWVARLRWPSREGTWGKISRVIGSLAVWLLGDVGLWASCAVAIVYGLLCTTVVLDGPGGYADLAIVSVVALPVWIAGLWLTRAGGPLRALSPQE